MSEREDAKAVFRRRFLPSFSVLRSFESAARHESFTLAAEELNLTQSAISRQIKELESAIGVELFRRVGRRVQLSEAGSAFAEELAQDLERIRQTVFRAIAAGDRGVALRIAVLPTFASRWLIPRLPSFEALCPDIQINVSARPERFDLNREHYDVALHFGQPNWPEAKMQKLCEEKMLPVAAPAFIKRFAVRSPASLLEAPLLHLESRPWAWNDWFDAVGIEKLGALGGKQFGQFSMIIAGAIAGLGAALVPSFLIEKELADGRLTLLNPVGLTTQNAYYIVTPKGSVSPQVSAFTEWMVSCVAGQSNS